MILRHGEVMNVRWALERENGDVRLFGSVGVDSEVGEERRDDEVSESEGFAGFWIDLGVGRHGEETVATEKVVAADGGDFSIRCYLDLVGEVGLHQGVKTAADKSQASVSCAKTIDERIELSK